MPRVIVRKGYRCQPGKRREVLAALQRIDAAAAGAGYPRGRYLLVETRAPGEPDLEVEFTFESYAEMEQLERRMREHVARSLRNGGGTGQEHLLEPSATRYLLLVEDGSATPTASPVTSSAPPRRSPAPPVAPTRAPAAPPPAAPPPGVAPAVSSPAAPPPGVAPAVPPANPEDDASDDAFEEIEEPDVPPPPEIPPGMTAEEWQAAQLTRARAALTMAERTAGTTGARRRAPERAPTPDSHQEPAPDQPPDQPSDQPRERAPGPRRSSRPPAVPSESDEPA